MKKQGGRGKQILDKRKNRAKAQRHVIARLDGVPTSGWTLLKPAEQ